jgi:putative DNA primase/helicase
MASAVSVRWRSRLVGQDQRKRRQDRSRDRSAGDPALCAQYPKAEAGRIYGAAARAFLRRFAADLAEARESVSGIRKAFLESALPVGAEGQARRVADRFALVAAAGELAKVQGVTGWPEGAAVAAALRCFRDWLAERGGIRASKVLDARAWLNREFEVSGHSRFLPWRPDSRKVIRKKLLGFVQRAEDTQLDAATTFHLHASGMAEVLEGLDRKTVLGGLAVGGVILRHQAKGEEGEALFKLNTPLKVPGLETH